MNFNLYKTKKVGAIHFASVSLKLINMILISYPLKCLTNMTEIVKFNFQNPQENSGYLLWQVSMLWQKKMNRALAALELTHTQFVILAALGWLTKDKEEVTQIDIANHSNTDRMMVSKIISNLQEKGIIQRQEHSTDTRAKTISLTTNGKKLLQKALKVVEDTDEHFFLPLSNKAETFNKSMLSLLDKEID